jgi:hypothetical protein
MPRTGVISQIIHINEHSIVTLVASLALVGSGVPCLGDPVLPDEELVVEEVMLTDAAITGLNHILLRWLTWYVYLEEAECPRRDDHLPMIQAAFASYSTIKHPFLVIVKSSKAYFAKQWRKPSLYECSAGLVLDEVVALAGLRQSIHDLGSLTSKRRHDAITCVDCDSATDRVINRRCVACHTKHEASVCRDCNIQADLMSDRRCQSCHDIFAVMIAEKRQDAQRRRQDKQQTDAQLLFLDEINTRGAEENERKERSSYDAGMANTAPLVVSCYRDYRLTAPLMHTTLARSHMRSKFKFYGKCAKKPTTAALHILIKY